jgi:cyclopropane-fatty-acyl-phospholipid synthase
MISVLRKYLESFGQRTDVPFRVVFADGSHYQNRSEAPRLTFRFHHRSAQWKTLLFGHIGLMESYFNGDMDVEGDFRQAFRFGMDSRMSRHPNPLVRLRNRRHEWRFSNRSIPQAKANARFHYGLGTPFYKLWLDRALMMYTCAYWTADTTTVEEAQRNKVDHVCRKVRLRPGESFVDIGCGFGGILFHAYEHYGARGTGINTTTEQVDYVREEIGRRGLTDEIQIREADFREIEGQYDKVISVGVLEHAGRGQLAEVVKAHADCLKPGGLGMLHFIGHLEPHETEYFIREHIFPGGWIPSLAETLLEMHRNGLEVLEIENLRRHYALTLDVWAERFDAHWETIHQLDPGRFDERFRRVWRTYLYACAEMFRSPATEAGLFQITYSKGNVTADSYPMTLDFLYRPDRTDGP